MNLMFLTTFTLTPNILSIYPHPSVSTFVVKWHSKLYINNSIFNIEKNILEGSLIPPKTYYYEQGHILNDAIFLLSISDTKHDTCIQVSHFNKFNEYYAFIVQLPYFTIFHGISFDHVLLMNKEHELNIWEKGKVMQEIYKLKVIY